MTSNGLLDLQDQIPQIYGTLDVYIGQLSDAREFYKERVAIERQAAERLAALAKKAQERYAARESALCVGESPAKAWNRQNNSFTGAWATVIKETNNEANDRNALADALQREVVDSMKGVIAKRTELLKKHYAFYNAMVSERDKTLSNKDNAKARYDSTCADLESHRAKQEHATADHKAERAGRHFGKASVEMSLAKNDYLRSIAVANAAKEHFFLEDMPAMTKTWQQIWMLLIRRCVAILLRAGELAAYQRNAAVMLSQREQQAVGAVDALVDQGLYAQHNQRTFFKPPDATFEPCAVWLDTDGVDLSNDQSRVFLQNSVAAAKRKLDEPTSIASLQRDVDGIERLVAANTQNAKLGDPDDAQEGLLDSFRQLITLGFERCKAQADIHYMTQGLGGDLGGGKAHELKATSFAVPVACAVCGSNIWGVGKPGSTCRACGQSVHKACELKLPAYCGTTPPPAAIRKPDNGLSRTTSVASTGSSARTPPARPPPRGNEAPSSARSPPSRPPPRGATAKRTSRPTSTAIYQYQAAEAGELSVQPGDPLVLVEPDDGNGWVRCENTAGQSGLVPAAYLVTQASNYDGAAALRVVHDFSGQGGQELSVAAGDRVSLAGKGRQYGSGWIEVTTADGQQGLLPEWAVQ